MTPVKIVSVKAVSKGITKLSGSIPLVNVRMAIENAIAITIGKHTKKEAKGRRKDTIVLS
jgi:hypothetical protein